VQVKDINTQLYSSASSAPADFAAIGAVLYFRAADDPHGRELWKSDGTPAGTRLVKDIYPGQDSSIADFPLHNEMVSLNGLLYFAATDGETGVELWSSNGTEDGTTLVKDIRPGRLGSGIRSLIAINGWLFFSADDGQTGFELWKSDGTAQGTMLVKDVFGENTTGSYPANMIDVNGVLYFTTAIQALWKSDGTTAGTVLVKDAPTTYGERLSNLTNVNGTLFFISVSDSVTLWKSDGTKSGTVAIKTQLYAFVGMVNVNGTLFFSASQPQPAGVAHWLWKSDGSPEGTVAVKQVDAGSLIAFANKLFFIDKGSLGGGSQLLSSDGSESGTTLIKDLGTLDAAQQARLFVVDGNLFYLRSGFISELWKSDGTTQGTQLIKSIGQTTPLTEPAPMLAIQGRLYFAANTDQAGHELWTSDGTTGGSTLVKDIAIVPGSSSPANLTALGGRLYFTADDGQSGREPWSSDGTPAGTALIKDINSGSGSSNPSDLTIVGSRVFFVADDGQTGRALWSSDGTPAGTAMIKLLNPSLDPSGPLELTNVNGTLYFVELLGTSGAQLWRSDGTSGGTQLVREFVNPGNLFLLSLAPLGDMLYIGVSVYPYTPPGLSARVASAPSASADLPGLWRSDGTGAGTVLIQSFGTLQTVTSLTPTSDGMYFFVGAVQLWKSSGSTIGAMLVKDFATVGVLSSDSSPLADFNRGLYFITSKGAESRLWRSDGTPAGATLVRELDLACGYPIIRSLAQISDRVYFIDGDQAAGCGLWRSDGTPEGTMLLGAITPDNLNDFNHTAHYTFASIAGRILLSNDNGDIGQELWKIDGNSANSLLLQDLAPGVLRSDVRDFTIAGRSIFFSATDGSSGRELWALPLSTFLDQSFYAPAIQH
jgi:ELWxxDGT repeat protein